MIGPGFDHPVQGPEDVEEYVIDEDAEAERADIALKEYMDIYGGSNGF